MKHGSLFSGIGGFDLAAEWMGWNNIFHCENNKFCQKVLLKHFPNSIQHGDIKTTDFTDYRGRIDIVSGGFPCQPYSTAGKRKGNEDDRHLWPEMLRAIREIQPRWVVGENVPGLLNWERGVVLDEIKTDLEAAGFEVFPSLVLPACGKNAPHKRDRVWIVAYSENIGYSRKYKPWEDNDIKKRILQEYANERRESIRPVIERPFKSGAPPDNNHERLQRSEVNGSINESGAIRNEQSARYIPSNWSQFPTQPPLCGRNDGIPNRVDRIKSLGNAIVPQVVYEIFKAIEQTEIAMGLNY